MRQLPITIVGNLVDEPDLRFTASGAAVVALNVAHNPSRYDKAEAKHVDGEPTFFRCVAWRELAEHLAESLKQGTRVIIYGYLRTERWESDGRGQTAAGTKLSRTVIDIESAGPELRWATAEVRKVKSTGSGPADDPWATASRTRPDGAAPAAGFPDDEPPF